MNKFRFILIAAAALLLPAVNNYAQPETADASFGIVDPVGKLVYCLPSTSIVLEVEAEKTTFYAGPYARYASKYLGVEAKQKDGATTEVTAIKVIPCLEADQSARYTIDPANNSTAFLQLTAQGLISTGSNVGVASDWRFAVGGKADFSDKGVTSNLTSESTTLYRNVKNSANYNKVAIQQNMVVTKSLDERAKEAANMIFDLRKKRFEIITGDTDASYTGEAMGAALEEITRLEKEYLSMFIGYSETQTQKMRYDIVPEADKTMYIAFRVSQSAGLVPADDMTGKPYMLNLVPQPIGEVPESGRKYKGEVAHYRIPAICDLKITDGVNVLLQNRIPVYQFGVESSFPLKSRK